MDKTKYICGICEKGFTRNASLRRHKQNVHYNNSFNCLTCSKKFKRQEDSGKHAKVCLKEKLEAGEPKMLPFTQLNQPNRQMDELDVVRGDLALSDSKHEPDSVLNIMVHHLNTVLLNQNTRNVETNTDSSRVYTCDKSTKTEPLIVLSPDKLIEFKDGLTIASFNHSLKIFVETLNSTIVMSKPNLESPPEPTTQIGSLKVQPTSSKANQTKLAPTERKNQEWAWDDLSDSENQELIRMCSRKPTRPTMFVPQSKRGALKAKLLDMPCCSKSINNE